MQNRKWAGIVGGWIGIYVICSFIAWDTRPETWGCVSRFFFICFLIAWAAFICIPPDENPQEPDAESSNHVDYD